MGNLIEINDTLKLRRGDGFPENIKLGGVYNFEVKGKRLYNSDPTRVFLVEEIEGKWNYIGHALIQQYTVNALEDKTTGIFKVILLYPPEYVLMLNQYEPPKDKGHMI